MWRTVSFLAAQASLTSWSEARMSTIRDVMMVRNTGCRNSRRIPRPINRSFSIEPPHVDPAILTGTGSGQYCGWPQISSLPRPRIKLGLSRTAPYSRFHARGITTLFLGLMRPSASTTHKSHRSKRRGPRFLPALSHEGAAEFSAGRFFPGLLVEGAWRAEMQSTITTRV
jgi:hypothetical protein